MSGTHRLVCFGFGLTFVIAAAAFSSNASAHISLDQASTHKSRYGDGQEDIKDAPCGHAGGTRGTNVYTYAPGQTITVEIAEYIPHPGYFRIAFDEDGDDGFKDPVSIKPLDPARGCPSSALDQCGTTDDFQDFYNTPEVLEGMDNLNPHLTATFGQLYSWEVQLPNVQCDNCTLQIIQVMEDDAFHGPYNTDPSLEPTSYVADVYHQCIDLVLEGPLLEEPDAAGSAGTGGGATPSEEDTEGGACSCTFARREATAAAHAGVLALVLGLFLRRRNRSAGL